jgi:8-oxo-dGTP diphosphatase
MAADSPDTHEVSEDPAQGNRPSGTLTETQSSRPAAPSGPKVRVSAFIARGGAVLLVRHSRQSRDVWLLPGGGVERGETLEAALQREVREETGLRVHPAGPPIAVIQVISPDDGSIRHLIEIVFEARPADDPGALDRDSSTWGPRDAAITAVDWAAPADLSRLPVHPPIQDVLERWLRSRATDPTAPLAFSYSGALWAPE